MKTKKVKAFMDGVDWQYEIGEAMGGNTVYGSVSDLKEHNKCWESCGIVEVEVKLVKWIAEQDWSKGSTIPAGEMNQRLIKTTQEKIAKLQAYLARLEEEEKSK